MDESSTYQVEVLGTLSAGELNAGGPLQIADLRTRDGITRFNVRGDQSGLIGLLRYLHLHGLLILGFSRETSSILEEP
ncbi:MAG: hypothetical protein JW862_04295 [Anaerolineales bacterium]|nr:hypothetical protein [Anaerolineales bacterium]